MAEVSWVALDDARQFTARNLAVARLADDIVVDLHLAQTEVHAYADGLDGRCRLYGAKSGGRNRV